MENILFSLYHETPEKSTTGHRMNADGGRDVENFIVGVSLFSTNRERLLYFDLHNVNMNLQCPLLRGICMDMICIFGAGGAGKMIFGMKGKIYENRHCGRRESRCYINPKAFL